MAWIELADQRNERSRTYQDDADSLRRCWSGTLAHLHYEGTLDSDLFDAEVDLTPQRVNVAAFDGWRVEQNGWHYALGKDLAGHGDQDGWVGFGGRQGAHWFKFRLTRVGYLYWPTRTWQDVGGAPTYNRANLSQATSTLTIGPNADPVAVESMATWANLWTTPGGGSLSASWRADGDRLKELVTVNQAGREWIAANRPPTTPLTETWFGFVFQVDWSDIPQCVRAGVVQDLDGDFADDGESIELRDALDRILGLMPVSEVIVPSSGVLPGPAGQASLRKRFYKDGSNYYLLVGVRCDVLQGLPAGDLIFDPTVDKTVAAGADDGVRYTGAYGFNAAADYAVVGHNTDANYLDCNVFFRWTGVTIAGTIGVAYVEIYDADTWGQAAPYLKVFGVDEDNPAAPTSAAEFDADPLTTAGVDWDGAWTKDAYNQSPSLTAIFQELVDSYTISADAVMVQVKNDGGAVTRYNYCNFYEHAAPAYPAKLHIEYTATLTVSISDTVSVTDSVTVSVSGGVATLTPSVSDNVSVSESLTANLSTLTTSISDNISLSEVVTVNVRLAVNAAESIAVAESISAATDNPQVTVSDTVAMAESYTVSVKRLVAVSESIAVAESVALVTGVEPVSVSDTVSVGESVVVAIGFTVNVSDAIGIAESLTTTISNGAVSVSEAVGISESVAVALGFEVNVFEAIGVAESVIAAIGNETINVSEAIGVAESIGAYLVTEATAINVSESIGVAESITAATDNEVVSVSESVGVSEAVTTAVALAIDTSESIVVAESVVVNARLWMSIADNIAVSESVVAVIGLEASVSDSVAVAESMTVFVTDVAYTISVSDNMALTDAVALSPLSAAVSITDSISVSDVLASLIVIGLLDITLEDSAVTVLSLVESLVYGISLGDAAVYSLAMTDTSRT